MPVPALVRPKAPPTTPESVSVSLESAVIVLTALSSTAPASEAVPTPVSAVPPFSVTTSAPTAAFAIVRLAPLATFVPPAVEPSAVACAATSVPVLICVRPS